MFFLNNNIYYKKLLIDFKINFNIISLTLTLNKIYKKLIKITMANIY